MSTKSVVPPQPETGGGQASGVGGSQGGAGASWGSQGGGGASSDVDPEVEVRLRGAPYVITLRGEFRQEVKGDPSRWRSVRRVKK